MTAAPLILLFGMHRSGTSALTRALSLGGLTLPRTLLEARADNAEGYWESARLVAINEQVLQSLGGHGLAALNAAFLERELARREGIVAALERVFEREFATDQAVVVKDPRMCLLAAAHLEAARRGGRQVFVVLLVRDAASVARSLVARNVVSRAYAGLLWRQHVLLSEAATRATSRLLVRHADFLADPAGVVLRIRALAGLDDLSAPAADPSAIAEWVRPERVHWKPDESATTESERAVMATVFGESADRERKLAQLLAQTLDESDDVDPGCPSLFLSLQSNATIAWAQVAALAMDRGVSATPGAIDRYLCNESLRIGALGGEV